MPIAMAAIVAGLYPEIFAAAGIHSGLASGAASNLSEALGAMKNGSRGIAAKALHAPCGR
jgi:poly(3-hydroxybutyrate) depolymerase